MLMTATDCWLAGNNLPLKKEKILLLFFLPKQHAVQII